MTNNWAGSYGGAMLDMVGDGDLATGEHAGIGMFGWKSTRLNWEETLDTISVLKSKECLPRVILGAFLLIRLNSMWTFP